MLLRQHNCSLTTVFKEALNKNEWFNKLEWSYTLVFKVILLTTVLQYVAIQVGLMLMVLDLSDCNAML